MKVFVQRMINYFSSVRSEISKVTWFDKTLVLSCSLLVLLVVLVAAIFFLVVDITSYKIVNYFLTGI